MVTQMLAIFRYGGRFALIFALVGLLATIALPLPSGAQTSDAILTIETIGTAQVEGDGDDVASAEQTAVNNALQLAVDEGVATVLSSEILTDNFEDLVRTFYGSADTFILSYKKLAMAKGSDYCRVLVRSSILTGDIKKRIEQAGILIDREQSPRLLILLVEERPGRPVKYWWRKGASKDMTVAEKAMSEDLARRGITVVPHDRPITAIDSAGFQAHLSDKSAVEIGRNLDADFVITGNSSLVFQDDDFKPGNTVQALGVIEARLLDIETGDRIFMTSLQHPIDDSQVPPDALSALTLAGTVAAGRFSPVLLAAFEQQRNRSRLFHIRIRGAGYLTHLNTFRNFLDTIDRIDRPQINEMNIDEAVISVHFSGTIRELAAVLGSTPDDRLTITVTDVLADSIVVELKTPETNADLYDTEETVRP